MSEMVNIPLSILMDDRLSLSDIRIFAILNSQSTDNKNVSITREELARLSGVKKVSRHTQKLMKYEYIQIDKSGIGNRNTYTIMREVSNKKEQITLSEYASEFLEYSVSQHSWKTYRTNRTAFCEFCRFVGDKPLAAIGVRDIEQFLIAKKKEASDWTARKYYGSLASAFEKAVSWKYLKENPFRKVKKPKPPETQPSFFTEEEFNKLMFCINDNDFRELVLTDLLTGLRLAELLTLRWQDIDFVTKTIQIRNSAAFTTKTRKNRVVPINENLYILLQNRIKNIRNGSEYIFPDQSGKKQKDGTISQKFKRYVRKAGLNDKLHFHNLRHTFASWLVQKGVSLYAVKEMLGHSDLKTTEMYSHLLPEQLHREVNKLAGMFKL